MSTYTNWGVLTLAIGVSFGAVAAAAPASADSQVTSRTVTAKSDAPPTYLFAINSKRGTVRGVGKDTGKEKLTLVLRGVSDHATQFADRPIRDAFVLSTKDLEARWDRWFHDSDPNAVLSFSQGKDPMPHSIVVKLRKPRYNEKKGTLTFTARHLHRHADLSPDAREKITLPKRRPPAHFRQGSLFIDSVSGCLALRGDGVWWANSDCSGLDLSGLNLSGRNLTEANLRGANLSGANLSGARLNSAKMQNVNLTGANLKNAWLTGYTLTDYTQLICTGTWADRHCEPTVTNYPAADLSNANLRGADLEGAFLREVNLTGANMEPLDKKRTNLSWTDLSRANLTDVKAPLVFLTGAKLADAQLVRADLSQANTAYTNAKGANAVGANLSNSGGIGSGMWEATTDSSTTCPNGQPGPCG